MVPRPKLGIRRETKTKHERRSPLVPEDVRSLCHEASVDVVVQPSAQRVFADEEFVRAGASLSEDLRGCSLILGIKEVAPDEVVPRIPHLFFSHTIKGQPANMPMLQRFLDLESTLMDHEGIVGPDGLRLVFFGRQAGQAGMINTLWSLGQREVALGRESLFGDFRQAMFHPSLAAIEAAIRPIGAALREAVRAGHSLPLTCAVTGIGNVSQGAQDVFEWLEPVRVSPAELRAASVAREHGAVLCVFDEPDFVTRRDVRDERPVTIAEYREHPERFEACLDRYVPCLDLLVNGIYWDERYPRLITKARLREWFAGSAPRLKVIGDVSCDVGGSIECTERATYPDRPTYVYDPIEDRSAFGFDGRGIVVLAEEILPTELPRDSSHVFSKALTPFLPALLTVDYTKPLEGLGLPAAFESAVIAHQGALAPRYQGLREFVRGRA